MKRISVPVGIGQTVLDQWMKKSRLERWEL